MLPNIIGFVLFLLAIFVLFQQIRSSESVGAVGAVGEVEAVEAFSFPVQEHQEYVEASQKKLNSLTNMIQLTDPVLPVQSMTAKDMYGATHGMTTKPTSDEYALRSNATFEIPSEMPSSLQQAIGCQKAPNTCGAFDDSVFATNCGMSFDRSGAGSDGKPHVGGLYVAPDDREIQTARATKVRESGIPPYDPYQVYQPTLGIAKPGTFALTKDQCVVVKEKVDCEEKQTFGSPNCTQCFPSQRFARVGPETPTIPSTLHLQGRGSIIIESPGSWLNVPLSELKGNSALKVTIPAGSEGKTFMIRVLTDNVSSGQPIYLSGYLEGPTGRGPFMIDINTVIQSDLETQSRPRMSGTTRVNGFRALSFIPGTGKKMMRLACIMPFSFISVHEPDAITCDNGPIVTKEASATFLESDPCYGKRNKVGAYTFDCLQSRWIAMGGTTEGTGYPSTLEKANAIQREGGQALSLDDIMDRLSVKIQAAITGKRASGKQMDVPEWNELSMWALGIPISSPCDGIQKDNGPLSQECLSYLYNNRGSGGRIGATFTQSATAVASKKSGGVEGWLDVGEAISAETYPYPKAPMDPSTPAGLIMGQRINGGVEKAKEVYDTVVRRATDNTKTNAERSLEVKAVYGVDLPPPSAAVVPGPTQVFMVGPDYRHAQSEAAGVCQTYGAKVATTAQLEEAQKAGADWCFSGWVAEGGGKWPVTTSVVSGCGNRQGVISWTPETNKAGVTCYGPKPRPTDVAQGVILPFNGDMWDQPTEKTYITIPSGYLESSGPQPACFDGLSPDEAKKGCDRLGSQCVGFSYSKDGQGSGCYKGNHAAGINTNVNYMGYVKIPTGQTEPVDGRYLRLEYDHIEFLNLAQIFVYSSKSGPNIITASTKVTKSSGYEGDTNPSSNFVNQNGNKWGNYVHTSCYDVPWIEVDLGSTVRIYKIVVWNRQDCCQERIVGTVLSVLNEEREKVYISNPIRTTNQSYTWMPPNGEVLVDRDPMPPPDWQKTYGNNGSTSCEQYCRGVNGGPWNGELPSEWNGARCIGYSSNVPNCNSSFQHNSSSYCLCEKTGTGWDTRGWRGP